MNSKRILIVAILILLSTLGIYLYLKGRNTAMGTVQAPKQSAQNPPVQRNLDHGQWYKVAYQNSSENIQELLQDNPLNGLIESQQIPEIKKLALLAYQEENTFISAMAYRAIGIKNNNDSLYLLSGNVFMEHAQTEGLVQDEVMYSLGSAIEMYEKSLKINPNNIPANNSLAVALIQEGLTPPMMGISYIKKSLAIDSNDISTNYLYAQMLTMSSQFEKAINIYNKLINLQPSNASLYFSISEIYGKLGNTKQAKEYLEKAKSLNNQ